MVTDLYQYVSNQNFNNRQEVYGYLASQIDSQTLSQQEIESKFLEREAMGNIEIAQGVVLPTSPMRMFKIKSSLYVFRNLF